MSPAFENATQAAEVRLVNDLLQRQRLFEKLTRIQRSISHRAPLQEVLDAITTGAGELLGDEVVGLRTIDEKEPTQCLLLSSFGVKEHLVEALHRTPVGRGAGWRAIRENRLVVIEDYQGDDCALRKLAEDGPRAAMAAPVHENGVVMGSLTVASYRAGRRYSAGEQEALTALAEHASLAVADAKMVEAMHEAQGARDLFNAMVSHELKTPLTVITGTLQTLGKHHARLPDETRDKMIASAQERAQELRKIIDRLLQGARAELAGTTEETLLPDLIAGAINGFDQSRRLSIDHVPPMPVTVDAPAVQELIGILMENAVSHSGAGNPISISVQVVADDVRVTVGNTGSLPADLDHSSLFAPFNRGPKSSSSGVGLGLYIAYRLAHSLHGDIEVASTEDSVDFTLRFPRTPPRTRQLERDLTAGWGRTPS
ncbi:MAG: ATP-binding protein [Actinomycetota bacterium]